MSIFQHLTSPRPEGFDLRGPDGTFQHGKTTFTRKQSPKTWVGEGTWNSFDDEYRVTVDRPGEKDDVVLSLFEDLLIVNYPNRPDYVTVQQQGGSMEIERLSSRENATLALDGESLIVDRRGSREDVTFEDKGYRYSIERFGQNDDVRGNRRRVRRGEGKLPTAEALDFVDQALENGLHLENMVTLGLDGRVTFWDEKLR